MKLLPVVSWKTVGSAIGDPRPREFEQVVPTAVEVGRIDVTGAKRLEAATQLNSIAVARTLLWK